VAYDIRVADGNVIVVGIATRGPNYDDSGESACYWLNGELHFLEDISGVWSVGGILEITSNPTNTARTNT
jgi:hypothetical protein